MLKRLVTLFVGSALLGACSSTVSVPSKPVGIVQPIKTESAEIIKNRSKNYTHGSVVPISELTTIDEILTARADNLFMNRRHKFVFGKNSLLKFSCKSRVKLIEVNGQSVSVNAVLENKDHVSTGCNKSNGYIRYVKFER